jgi:hypothetical protein
LVRHRNQVRVKMKPCDTSSTTACQ